MYPVQKYQRHTKHLPQYVQCQYQMSGKENVNLDRASDGRDRWFDLRAEQCDVRPNK